jgi:hypothetical protein
MEIRNEATCQKDHRAPTYLVKLLLVTYDLKHCFSVINLHRLEFGSEVAQVFWRIGELVTT